MITSTLPITTSTAEGVTTTSMTTSSTSIRETRRQKAEAYLEDLIRNHTSSPKTEAPSEPPTTEAENAEIIGSIGIIFMALFLSLFVILDIISLRIYLEPMRENLRQLKELITK